MKQADLEVGLIAMNREIVGIYRKPRIRGGHERIARVQCQKCKRQADVTAWQFTRAGCGSCEKEARRR